MNKNKPAIFPGSIIPDSVEKSMFHIFKNDDFTNLKEAKRLIGLIYKHPERKFYLFVEHTKPLNQYLMNAKNKNKILMNICEQHFYPHPKFERDYIKIHKNNINFDWERDVLNKGPMFKRITLILTEEEKKKLDLKRSHAKLYCLIGIIVSVLLTVIAILFTNK